MPVEVSIPKLILRFEDNYKSFLSRQTPVINLHEQFFLARQTPVITLHE